MPALKIRRVTPQLFGAWVRATRRRYRNSRCPARKGEIRVGPGRKRLRQYREIMQLVLMSVGERLAPPFNRVQAEAGPSFRRAPPGASPKGGIIVAQPAAAGRVGLELNSESRRDAASYSHTDDC